jgi:hypothetical protein
VNGYQQRVNTNLEEISDWLTKIIVGLGLIELRQMPAKLDQLAGVVEQSMAPNATRHSVAVAVIISFSLLGFLFGYLITRLYIQGALSRAEDGSYFEKVLQSFKDALRTSGAALGSIPGDAQEWNTDPFAGFANGRSEANNRRLTATITPAAAGQSRVQLAVTSTDPANHPLTGEVRFHLHPTFVPPDRDVQVDDGVATLEILSWGVFTVGAEADNGTTKLELDLATVQGGTPLFYRN